MSQRVQHNLCLYFTTGHFHTCTMQRMQPISLLILGSHFSDCVVFYGDYLIRSDARNRHCGIRHSLLICSIWDEH